MYDFHEIPATINESHWGDATIPSITAYNLSKLLAEKAAWEFLDHVKEGEHKPELVTILPGFTCGQIIGKGASSSVDVLKYMLRGKLA